MGIDLAALTRPGIQHKVAPSRWVDGRDITFVAFTVAAKDAPMAVKLASQFLCDNFSSDDQAIQAAVHALPPIGGLVVLSAGTFTLAAQIARTIDNVTIVGQGQATILNLDGSTAVITEGSQSGWSVWNLVTDAGGVLAPGIVLRQRGSVGAPAAVIVRDLDGDDLIRIGRTGALPGLFLGNNAHLAFFTDAAFTKEVFHFDCSDGYGKVVSLGFDWMAANRSVRAKFNPDPANLIYGGRAIRQVGMPERSSDPATDRDTGTVTFAGGNSITDTSKSWSTDQFANYILVLTGGTGKGQVGTLVGNNVNTLTLEAGQVWVETPDGTTTYEVAQVFAGDMWYDTATNTLKYWDGTAIKTVATV